MSLSIATWNINSVRLRAPLVERLLTEHMPDVLCLQEIKCMNDQFPAKVFRKLGYEYHAVHGQKGYHGVAIVSKIPLLEPRSTNYCGMGDTRHIAVDIEFADERMAIHNFYVPAGGDIPDTELNPKFAHKLNFIEEMRSLKSVEAGKPAIMVGDLNVAPLENDVWSHKQLLKVVSHTPVETEGLMKVLNEGGWVDLIRHEIPEDQKIYTWWSYRARDWDQSDRGRRLDHIWSDQKVADKLKSIEILRHARGWEKASDHVPVIARFEF